VITYRHHHGKIMKRTIPPDWHLRARLKARQLALLVAIADHRSLRRAAQEIAVTQPAATRMLADLEDALGVPLFDRFAWGMQSTPYGDTLIRYARGMLTDLSEARDEIAALASGAKGKLRVGSVTGAVPRLLAPALRAVREGRPGLKVFVLVNTSDVLAAALRQGTLDVAIGQLPADVDAAEFAVEPLRDEPLCLVARAGHPLARAKSIDAASLAGVTWILHPPDSGMRADVNALLARARLTLPGDLIETVSIVATLALLQGSDAVSVLPVDLADYYREYALLARLNLRLPAGGSTTELLTRRNRRLAPAAQDFVAALRLVATSAKSPSGVLRGRTRPSGRR
jgi:DNA-binding transcriptional LysR family regulator